MNIAVDGIMFDGDNVDMFSNLVGNILLSKYPNFDLLSDDKKQVLLLGTITSILSKITVVDFTDTTNERINNFSILIANNLSNAISEKVIVDAVKYNRIIKDFTNAILNRIILSRCDLHSLVGGTQRDRLLDKATQDLIDNNITLFNSVK